MKYFSGDAFLIRRMAFRAWATALGAAGYFALPFEPNAGAAYVVAAIVLLAAFLLRRSHDVSEAAWLVCFALLGFAAGAYESARLNHPNLREETPRSVAVFAALDALERREKSAKLYLSDVKIGDLSADPLPYRVRLSLRDSQIGDANVGDSLYLPAVKLRPMPPPAIAGGYDFSFFAYFDGVGAVGFALSNAYVTSKEKTQPIAAFIARLRKAISERFMQRMAPDAAALASALTVGMRGLTPDALQEAFRHAGLSHLLAISGMHVAMAAGLAFFVIRKILSYIPRFCAVYDARFIAAPAAIAVAGIYVLLAGSPVSAKRAFVMAAIFLIGVMTNRRAAPMHNVGLAAIGILLWRPHMALHPGFQMSFFAVCAILSLADSVRRSDATENNRRAFGLKRTALYFGGVLASSLAAGVATAPFSVYHFNQFSWLGLPVNMVAVPLTAMAIMPTALSALLFMPIGLDAPFCFLAEQAIGLLIFVAESSLALESGSLHPKAPSGGALLLLLSGMTLIYLSTRFKKLWGIAPIAAACYLYVHQPLPDIYVNETAEIFAVRRDDSPNLYVSDKRKSRYVVDQWRERSALDATSSIYGETPEGVQCVRHEGCVVKTSSGGAAYIAQTADFARNHCFSPAVALKQFIYN